MRQVSMARMNQIIVSAMKAVSSDVIRMITCGSFTSTLDLKMKRCHRCTTLFAGRGNEKTGQVALAGLEQLK